jgi:hypothetical protein
MDGELRLVFEKKNDICILSESFMISGNLSANLPLEL